MKNARINSFISVEFFAEYAGQTQICIGNTSLGQIRKEGSKWIITVQENKLGEAKTLAAAKELAVEKMREISETIEEVSDLLAFEFDEYEYRLRKSVQAAVAQPEAIETQSEDDVKILISDCDIWTVSGQVITAKAGYSITYVKAADLYKITANDGADLVERDGKKYDWVWAHYCALTEALKACEETAPASDDESAEEEAHEREQIIAEFAMPEGVVKFVGYPSGVPRRVELNGEEIGYIFQYPGIITYYKHWRNEIQFYTLREIAEFINADAKKRRMEKKAYSISYQILEKYGFSGNHAFICAVLIEYGEDKINLQKIAHNSIEIELGIDSELGGKKQDWSAADWEAAALFLMNKGGQISTDVQRYIAPKLGIQALLLHAQHEQYWHAVLAYHQEIKERCTRIFNADFLLAIQPQIMQLGSCKAFEFSRQRIAASAANIAETFINHLAKLGAS
jgi:hypothetical protein